MSLIIAQSRLSAAETHCRVRFDIMQRGWIPTDGEEEQSFDLIVDMGVVYDKREIQTIKVKSWKTLKTCSLPTCFFVIIILYYYIIRFYSIIQLFSIYIDKYHLVLHCYYYRFHPIHFQGSNGMFFHHRYFH